MQLYLDAAVQWGIDGKGYSQQALAAECQLSVFQVSRWHQDLNFRQALAEVFRQVQPILLEGAVAAIARMAQRGNLLAFNSLCDRLEKWGRIAVVAQASAPDGTPGVNALAAAHIHIHQIPEPASRSTLPPPLELPAKPSAATTTPTK